MDKNSLVIINNEKVFKENNDFYCDNYNLKILPEGLNNFYQVQYIVRNSKKKGGHIINLQNIKVASNIIQFIHFILRTFKIPQAKYLIIAITPYTFFSFLILFIFRKKVFVYLISSGHEEYKFILGSWSVWIYHIMYSVITSNSKVIVLHDRLHKEKTCHVVQPSSLDEKWLQNYKEADLKKIKFLYVGRVNPEKGIYEFLKMFEKMKLNAELTIVGNSKNLKISNKEVKLHGYISDQQSLIDIYDSHNIMILPSFTEGQPYVVDESLARKRPVIIFEDIASIIKGRNGIFVSKRNTESFIETVNQVMRNYHEIQKDIEKNKFSLKKDMLKQISDIVAE